MSAFMLDKSGSKGEQRSRTLRGLGQAGKGLGQSEPVSGVVVRDSGWAC